MLNELGITKEDILDRAAEKLIDSMDDGDYDLQERITLDVKSRIVDSAKIQIDEILAKALETLVDTPFQPVDEWGDKRGEATTLRELVKERAMRYLTEKVGEDGKATGYRSVGSRAEWLAKKAAKEAVDYATKKEIDAAVDKAKAEITKIVAQHITERILKR